MGYTYVMSDIHGMGALLEKMLEKLSFSEEDVLYILGDMIDRGPDPAKVLDIASSRGNIIPLRGTMKMSLLTGMIMRSPGCSRSIITIPMISLWTAGVRGRNCRSMSAS